MKRAACLDMASPFGARLLMCADGVSCCITALAIVRWRLSKFIRHAPERFSQESDSLSTLRYELREKSECCRPIQAMSQCVRLSGSRGRTASRPGQSPDDRGCREYIFRTWSDRQCELARRVGQERCSRTQTGQSCDFAKRRRYYLRRAESRSLRVPRQIGRAHV